MIRALVILPRLLAGVVIALIGAVGVLLVLEAVGVIDTGWRNELSEALSDFAAASWSGWAMALVGVGLGACAAVLAFGLFTTARPGGRRLFVVSRGEHGETRLRGRAVRNALTARLREQPAVLDARISLMRRRWLAELTIADNADLSAVDREARALLSDEFWSSVGVRPARIDLRFALDDVVAPGAEPMPPDAEFQAQADTVSDGEGAEADGVRA
jgi:hypothetical protein